MALDLTHDGLSHELKRSVEETRRYIGERHREYIRRFVGPAWKSGSPGTVDLYNHAYALISIYLPLLASGNPRVKNKTMQVGQAAAFAKALELSQNRNFELTDIKRTIEQLATDWFFRYCVAVTTPNPVAGQREHEDPLYRPTTKRLSLEDYTWDHISRQDAECRFKGHRIRRDKDSLLREAEEHPERRWSVDAILAQPEDDPEDPKRQEIEWSPRRGEIDFWEFWVPEHVLDKAYDQEGNEFQPTTDAGFNGTVFTVTENGGQFIREPRPFFGPPQGAYTVSSYLYVPDQVVGLSPILGTAVQEEQYQKVLAANAAAIQAFKVGIAVSSQAGSAMREKMAQFMDLGVFTLDGVEELDKLMKEITLGGLTQQHLVHEEVQRTALEKASGITEAKQGLAPDTTATAASIAQMSSGQRQGGMVEKFHYSVTQKIAERESWYLSMDPRTRTPMGPLAEGMFVNDMGMPIIQPVFVGGAGHGHLLREFEIEIQTQSTRFTSEMLELEKAASWEQFLLSTAPLIPQMPYVNWDLVYSKKAEQLGDPSLVKTIDVDKAMLMGMMMMQMQAGAPPGGAPQGGGKSLQPRLGIDLHAPSPASAPPQMKASEKPAGFSGNARPQTRKGPRQAGASSSTQ